MTTSDPAEAAELLSRGQGMVEIRQAVVEHYSNHLPTGKYAVLRINLQLLSGFSLVRMQ